MGDSVALFSSSMERLMRLVGQLARGFDANSTSTVVNGVPGEQAVLLLQDMLQELRAVQSRASALGMCPHCHRAVQVFPLDLAAESGAVAPKVKAAGVACLIGLGLSLGTLLLYRLYFRIIVPFLHSVWAAKGGRDALLDDEYTLHLESSESEVDDSMGNKPSKRAVPAVYYAPGYGVTVGGRPPTLVCQPEGEVSEADDDATVKLRPRRVAQHRKSPSPASDKDSAIGGTGGCGSEMSQSMFSELSNRDSFHSFYSTESGFDDMGGLLPEDQRRGVRSARGNGCWSLKENHSPASWRERNLQMLYRAHHGHDAGLNSLGRQHRGLGMLDTLSDCSSERSGVVSSCSVRSSCDGESTGFPATSSTRGHTNMDPLLQKLAAASSNGSLNSQHTVQDGHRLDSAASSRRNPQARPSSSIASNPRFTSSTPSPQHSSKKQSPLHSSPSTRRSQATCQVRPDFHGDLDPDPCSASIRSFNSSAGEEDLEWLSRLGDEFEDYEDMPHDHRDFLSSTAPPILTDDQFQQSLMQRIHEWSSFAEEYTKSRSPTPGSSPARFAPRRSRSLDRHLGDPGSVLVSDTTELNAARAPVTLEPNTERNLETLEYELHDIQGEFESITSKLRELIEQGGDVEEAAAGDSSQKRRSSNSNQCSPSHKAVNSSPRRQHSRQHQGGPTPTVTQHRQQQPQQQQQQQHPSVSAKLRRLRTRWEHVPSSACSTSSRSSRASSVEYAWDLADYTHNSTPVGVTADSGQVNSPARSVSHTGEETVNIAPAVSLAAYAEQEWKGNTEKARTIRQGYSKVPGLLSCHRLSVIRGDNYCGLRSLLFQVLSSGLRVTRGWSGIIGVMDRLHSLYNNGHIGLEAWTFAHRLPAYCSDRLASLSKCMLVLYATIEEVCNLPSREEREKRTINLLNTSATFDLELMEGLKIMMLLTLSDLQRQIEEGEDVPIFSHLLFARDSSLTIAEFLKNHLNCVGDTGGLEQVEMCLLAYALRVKVRVIRLAQLGQQDFDCIFPEDAPPNWPVVSLIAEDDRHYNVPLP